MRKLYPWLKKGILLAAFCCLAQSMIAQLPVIYSFSPDSGQFGTPETIRGIHFTGATDVRIGGWFTYGSISVVSDSVIAVVVGPGGTGAVTVKTPAGTASKDGFVYLTPPIVMSFNPQSGTKGTQVAINGQHFIGATAVRFGGVEADLFRVVTDNSIIACVGNGASGAVSVTSPLGSNFIPGFTYTGTLRTAAAPAATTTGNPVSSVMVYPNPANGYALVQHPAGDHAAYLPLTDLVGRIVKTINVNKNAVQTRVDLKGIAHGVYKLVWKNDGKFISQTLIIQ